MAKEAQLYADGWSMPQIAREMNLALSTVHADLSELETQARKHGMLDIARRKNRMLMALDRRRRTAMEAWEESRGQKRKQVARLVPGQDGQPTVTREAVVETTDSAGDPRFLAILAQCDEREARLLGLDAPKAIIPIGEVESDEAVGLVYIPQPVLEEPPPPPGLKKPKGR